MNDNVLSKLSLDVVIPTWNGKALLEICLTFLLPQLSSSDQLIIVDNGSDDGTLDWLKSSNIKNLTIIANDENAGFARAVNQGILAGTGAWVVLLNNDTKPEADWLSALRRNINGAPTDVGFIASLVLDSEGHRIDSAGDFVSAWGAVHPLLRGQLVDPVPRLPAKIFAATGGASAFRRQTLHDVDYFSEEYFAYFEDVDFCFRAQWRGWTGCLAPDARVRHAASSTSGRIPGWREELSFRNHVRLFVRTAPMHDLVKFTPVFLWVQLTNYLRLTDVAQRRGARKGFLSAMRGLRTDFAARRRIRKRAKLSSKEMQVRLIRRRGVLTSLGL